MSEKRKYDSTVARIAGNVASGMMRDPSWWPLNANSGRIAEVAVSIARAIVTEVQRPEPTAQTEE
jgi:hypothetical protein